MEFVFSYRISFLYIYISIYLYGHLEIKVNIVFTALGFIVHLFGFRFIPFQFGDSEITMYMST